MHIHRPHTTKTPGAIKWTIALTATMTSCSLAFNDLCTRMFGIFTPQNLLGLTKWGIHKGFLWQFLSYLLIRDNPIGEASLSIIFRLLFELYLLWSIGKAIAQARGASHFIALYFGGALFVSIPAYFFLHSHETLAGATQSIHILLIAWTFSFQREGLTLPFTPPIRAKWLVFGWMGIGWFLDFFNGRLFSCLLTTSALIYGYLYPIFVWEILSPFPKLHRAEKRMIYFKRMMRNRCLTLFKFALPSKK